MATDDLHMSSDAFATDEPCMNSEAMATDDPHISSEAMAQMTPTWSMRPTPPRPFQEALSFALCPFWFDYFDFGVVQK